MAGNGGALIWPQLVGFVRAKEHLFIGDLMTAAEAERIQLINHVVPADQLDEKVYGLARRLAGGAMRSIRRTKQVIKIPLRQLAHSLMDLSLSLETQSNLSKDHQEAVALASSSRASCCVTAAITGDRPGPSRIAAGWRGSSSSRRCIISCSRTTSRRSKPPRRGAIG